MKSFLHPRVPSITRASLVRPVHGDRVLKDSLSLVAQELHAWLLMQKEAHQNRLPLAPPWEEEVSEAMIRIYLVAWLNLA